MRAPRPGMRHGRATSTLCKCALAHCTHHCYTARTHSHSFKQKHSGQHNRVPNVMLTTQFPLSSWPKMPYTSLSRILLVQCSPSSFSLCLALWLDLDGSLRKALYMTTIMMHMQNQCRRCRSAASSAQCGSNSSSCGLRFAAVGQSLPMQRPVLGSVPSRAPASK